MMQLEICYKTSPTGIYWYLTNTQDWMLRFVYEHESNRTLHSVVKEAYKFARELDINPKLNGEPGTTV